MCPFSYQIQQHYAVVARFRPFQQNPFDPEQQANQLHVNRSHLYCVESSPREREKRKISIEIRFCFLL